MKSSEVKRGWVGRKVTRRYKVRRRTKSVTIVFREVYLRDDIPCGSALCQSCLQDSPPLPAEHDSHYLLPDADALLQFLEIWELPQITSVIYLASVVKEVLACSNQRNYRRLRSLFTDPRRRSLFFDDEHFIYTCLGSDSRENAKKQSGERVKAVASWFYEHLHGSVPVIALQTRCVESPTDELQNGLQNLSLSDSTHSRVENNFKLLTVDSYFKQFWHNDLIVLELYESLAQSLLGNAGLQKSGEDSLQHVDISGGKLSKGTSAAYKEHLPVHLLDTYVATGVLRAGIFHVNKREPQKGYVHPSNKGEASNLNISVPGRPLQNRALPGDLVAVRILNSRNQLNEGEVSSTSVDYSGTLDEPSSIDQEAVGEIHDVQKATDEELRPVGEVVGILQRSQRDHVACIAEEDEDSLRQSISTSRGEHLLCVPMDRRVPMVRIATRLSERLVGQRFVLRIDGWDQDSRIPRGHFVRLLGPIGDLNAETMALLVENGINTSPFNSMSIQELPEDSKEHPWTVPDEELARRRDLRFCHRTCSVDPPGSRDVDDALSVRRLPNKSLEIGVHIADVSYFVKQDSLVDLEAQDRGTTVYMVGKSWHMLPEVLSENLCSLIGGKDRLAVSVIWTVNPDNDFEVLDVWFGRTIIQSRHQMSYAQAQAILDGQVLLPPAWELSGGVDEVTAVASDLLILATFAQLRRDLRKEQGTVELSSSELRFETSANKEPISVNTKLELPMNWIVAEMMILANSFVAQKIHQTFPSKALLRRHDPPKLDNFTLLLECCAARGFSLDTSSNKALAESLDRMRDSNDPIVENAFRALATRAMSEAEYCLTSEARSLSGFAHYGLALDFYTHFTSPIRRYADIIVHRMLMASCEGNNPGLRKLSDEELSERSLESAFSGIKLKEVIDHLNERHRASKKAQKECNELYLLMYLQKHAQAEQAVVISFHEKGMIVFVPKYDIRALVYLLDKKGNIILPAEDDSIPKESLMPILEPRVLSKQPGCMRIINSQTRKVEQEYNLMDTVCVQLCADGSRAHAPKLRVQLLSSSHPAARRSMERQELTGLKKMGSLKGDAANRRPIHTRRVTRKPDMNKVVNDMVQIMGAEEFPSSNTKLMKKAYIKRKVPSINDVTEDFKRLKASPVYLDMIEDYDTSDVHLMPDTPRVDEKQIRVSKGSLSSIVRWMPLTVGMKLSEPALFQEQQIVKHLRQLWWKKMRKAAKVRAIRLCSILQEECEKQVLRIDKENRIRNQAKVVLWLI